MKLSWQRWMDVADKGTSGDQVYNILYDWREEREKLIKERAQFERKVEELTQISAKTHNECETLRATVDRHRATLQRIATFAGLQSNTEET